MGGMRAGVVGVLLEALPPVPVDPLLDAGESPFCELAFEPCREDSCGTVGIGVCCFSLPFDRDVTNFSGFVSGADQRC